MQRNEHCQSFARDWPAERPIMSINDYIASLCKKNLLYIANDPAYRLHNMLQSSGPSCYNLRCKRRFAIPKCKTERFKNSFLVRSCIDNEFQYSVSFLNEIDDVVYILTVLSFLFIFIGCYFRYIFRDFCLKQVSISSFFFVLIRVSILLIFVVNRGSFRYWTINSLLLCSTNVLSRVSKIGILS